MSPASQVENELSIPFDVHNCHRDKIDFVSTRVESTDLAVTTALMSGVSKGSGPKPMLPPGLTSPRHRRHSSTTSLSTPKTASKATAVIASFKSKAATVTKKLEKAWSTLTHLQRRGSDPTSPSPAGKPTESPEERKRESKTNFNPIRWQEYYPTIWQRYKEVSLMIQAIHGHHPQYEDRPSTLIPEWFMVVETIFTIKAVRRDRLLELPKYETTMNGKAYVKMFPPPVDTPSRCQIRAGQYSELLKMFKQLDITISRIPGWITDFDVLLKDIYCGLTSEVVKNSEEVFGIEEATNRRTGWRFGKKLAKGSRRQLLRQFY
ncbi:hypothetical protein BDZ88DRAFT_456298 [Geranomyces variabilis]|nr:hypothetical protein BDZ88DRAFT_456298 [Geranomyces variabilis]KAJ3135182.1 hypothetical protein HDU90_004214 [Geranomyces variabilis]